MPSSLSSSGSSHSILSSNTYMCLRIPNVPILSESFTRYIVFFLFVESIRHIFLFVKERERGCHEYCKVDTFVCLSVCVCERGCHKCNKVCETWHKSAPKCTNILLVIQTIPKLNESVGNRTKFWL